MIFLLALIALAVLVSLAAAVVANDGTTAGTWFARTAIGVAVAGTAVFAVLVLLGPTFDPIG